MGETVMDDTPSWDGEVELLRAPSLEEPIQERQLPSGGIRGRLGDLVNFVMHAVPPELRMDHSIRLADDTVIGFSEIERIASLETFRSWADHAAT